MPNRSEKSKNDAEDTEAQFKPCLVCIHTLKQTVNLCRHLETHQVPETFPLKLKASFITSRFNF